MPRRDARRQAPASSPDAKPRRETEIARALEFAKARANSWEPVNASNFALLGLGVRNERQLGHHRRSRALAREIEFERGALGCERGWDVRHRDAAIERR